MKSVLLVLALVIGTTFAASLPSYIKKCRRDKDLDKCAITSANAAIAKFAKGDEKLKIPSTDPLLVDELVVNESGSALSAKLKFNNISIRGIAESKMIDSKIDLHRNTIEWAVETPKLKMNSMYQVNGRFLVLPISGNGDCLVELEKFRLKLFINFKLVSVKGKEVIKIEKVNISHSTQKMKLRLDNLFNGNKVLSDNMNLVLNDNWEELNDQLAPAIVQSIAASVQNSLTRFFYQIPFSELLSN